MKITKKWSEPKDIKDRSGEIKKMFSIRFKDENDVTLRGLVECCLENETIYNDLPLECEISNDYEVKEVIIKGERFKVATLKAKHLRELGFKVKGRREAMREEIAAYEEKQKPINW